MIDNPVVAWLDSRELDLKGRVRRALTSRPQLERMLDGRLDKVVAMDRLVYVDPWALMIAAIQDEAVLDTWNQLLERACRLPGGEDQVRSAMRDRTPRRLFSFIWELQVADLLVELGFQDVRFLQPDHGCPAPDLAVRLGSGRVGFVECHAMLSDHATGEMIFRILLLAIPGAEATWHRQDVRAGSRIRDDIRCVHGLIDELYSRHLSPEARRAPPELTTGRPYLCMPELLSELCVSVPSRPPERDLPIDEDNAWCPGEAYLRAAVIHCLGAKGPRTGPDGGTTWPNGLDRHRPNLVLADIALDRSAALGLHDERALSATLSDPEVGGKLESSGIGPSGAGSDGLLIAAVGYGTRVLGSHRRCLGLPSPERGGCGEVGVELLERWRMRPAPGDRH